MTIVGEGMRAGEFAYRALLEEIQSGSLAAGTVLAEVEQADRLGVSRTPLREALRRLAADGLVEQVSPRVTVVAAIDRADIRDLFALRRALEESAARAAAASAGRTAFVELAAAFARAVDSLEDDSGRERYYALIARFDEALDAAVGNDYLTAALRTVRTHLVRVRRMARDKPDRLIASAAEHRLIAEAIASGDADLAAHATHVHLHNALASILGSLADPDAGPASTPDPGRAPTPDPASAPTPAPATAPTPDPANAAERSDGSGRRAGIGSGGSRPQDAGGLRDGRSHRGADADHPGEADPDHHRETDPDHREAAPDHREADPAASHDTTTTDTKDRA